MIPTEVAISVKLSVVNETNRQYDDICNFSSSIETKPSSFLNIRLGKSIEGGICRLRRKYYLQMFDFFAGIILELKDFWIFVEFFNDSLFEFISNLEFRKSNEWFF